MTKPLTYKDAGVDIDAGEKLVELIKPIATKTKRPEVQAGLGGFAALCAIPQGFNEPILVSATDGVGTKLRLALDLNRHATIGQDLVAMCVNDLVVCGAEPLFFLDYFATGKLDIAQAASVINGIGVGCEVAGCALVGGETAEMPGMYHNNDYDLAGFCVGVVEKNKIIDGKNVQEGDVLLGLASSGVHSNGFSLIRKIIEIKQIDLKNYALDKHNLADLLLAPTKIYVKPLLNLIAQNNNVKAMAHITGGGLLENIPRVLPKNLAAKIDLNSWQIPPLFNWLQQMGDISWHEMYRVLNCGVGMVICVAQSDVDNAISLLNERGEKAWILGQIVKRERDAVVLDNL